MLITKWIQFFGTVSTAACLKLLSANSPSSHSTPTSDLDDSDEVPIGGESKQNCIVQVDSDGDFTSSNVDTPRNKAPGRQVDLAALSPADHKQAVVECIRTQDKFRYLLTF